MMTDFAGLHGADADHFHCADVRQLEPACVDQPFYLTPFYIRFSHRFPSILLHFDSIFAPFSLYIAPPCRGGGRRTSSKSSLTPPPHPATTRSPWLACIGLILYEEWILCLVSCFLFSYEEWWTLCLKWWFWWGSPCVEPTPALGPFRFNSNSSAIYSILLQFIQLFCNYSAIHSIILQLFCNSFNYSAIILQFESFKLNRKSLRRHLRGPEGRWAPVSNCPLFSPIFLPLYSILLHFDPTFAPFSLYFTSFSLDCIPCLLNFRFNLPGRRTRATTAWRTTASTTSRTRRREREPSQRHLIQGCLRDSWSERGLSSASRLLHVCH